MKSQTTPLPAEALREIHRLYRAGKYVQAHDFSKSFGPFESWQSTDALLIAGRIAPHLGNRSLGRKLHHRAFRKDRKHAEAQYYFLWSVVEHRGPLAAWEWMKRFGDFQSADLEMRSDLLGLKARLAFSLRDFETAESLLREAMDLCPQRQWLMVERCYMLEAEDRYEEALEAAREAHAQECWYRPAVHALAHVLQLVNKDDESLGLLKEATRHIEGTSIWSVLAGLQIELKLFGEARESLEQCRANAPLIEKGFAQWLNSCQADTAYYCGDYPAAIAFAKQAGGPFHSAFAARLENAGAGKRVRLPVGFVRQHRMTCAPATLSALSKYWEKPAEHLSIAEKICYDGTPAYSERSWAEQNGWVAREFKVTQQSAEQLLERGVPFTLTTVDPGSAHLQAAVGFDETRRTLIIRDPFLRHTHEFQSENALKHYTSSGPRGMTMVPNEKSSLLDGIELPEAEHYDALHRINAALDRHDRAAAAAELEKMKSSAAEHRLTLQAQRILAGYDANLTEQLSAVEKLLQQFPKDVNLHLARLGCLRELAGRERRFEILKEVCAPKDSDPLLWLEQAYESSQDGREYPEAMRQLKRISRVRPVDPSAIYLQANLLWNQRRFPEAAELYRFAASLDDKKEHLAWAYFNAARHLKQTAKAMSFLKDRFRRLGKSSHFPATTLFWAYSELQQTKSAFEVLEKALALRPDDGQLLLYAADAYARHQDQPRARDLLQRAGDRVQKTQWLRTAATLADYFGELKSSLSLWRQVLEAEPLALDANRFVAQLTAKTEGRTAAQLFLEKACGRFPHNFALHTVWLDWLRQDGDAATEPVLRQLIAIDPVNAWARREMALALGRLEKFDEAFREAETSISLDPSNPAGFNVRGWLYLHQGKRAEAKTDLRKSISMAVDFGSAIADLLESCSTLAERKEAIAFIEQELIRQVVFGDGVLAFREVARPLLTPEELLASLRKALSERPDLWHAWSSVICQLTDMQRYDEALKLASEATERFPLLPRLWLDYARIHHARLEMKSEIAVGEKALQMSPSWGVAARLLAEAHERNGDPQSAKKVLEAHIARAPLDHFTHGQLAGILWKLGDKTEALSRLQQALQLDSNYEWAWNSVRQWARELNQPDLPAQMARALTIQRPGQSQNWVVLARTLDLEQHGAEAVEAVEKALSFSPRNGDAWDLKACLMLHFKRFDDALAACRPAVFGGKIPTFLRAREAWVFMRQGQTAEAIRQMRAVLAEDPSHYWGWKELADWLWQTGAHKEAVQAASQLSKLAPFDPIPLGYSGDMKRRLNDRDSAKNDFKRAMKLAPDYMFAGFSLFDMQMEDDETTSAEQTLHFLRQHINNDYLTARYVRLYCRLEKWEESESAFIKLCASKEDDDWPLRCAVAAFMQASLSLKAGRILEEHMKKPEANPNLGPAWVDFRFHQTKWFAPGALDRVTPEGEMRHRAVVRYIERLGENYHHYTAQRDLIYPWIYQFLLGRTLQKHRDWLRADDFAWGKVGFALTSQKRMKEVVDWLSDWKKRGKIEGWMLYNLALALIHQRRESEAVEVCRHGITLPFEGDIQQAFHVWLGLEEALAGNTEAARAHLSSVNPENLPSSLRQLEAYGWALIEVQGTPPAKRMEAFKAARKIIRDAQAGAWLRKQDKTTRQYFRRVIARLGADCQSLWPRIWGAYQHHGLLSVTIPILAISFGGMFLIPELIPVFMLTLVFSALYSAVKK